MPYYFRAMPSALEGSKCLLVIVSPLSVASDNVMDEVSYAIDERKDVVPVLAAKCRIPLRMRRLQFIDFTDDYGSSFKHLLIRLKTDPERNKDTTEKASDVSTREKMRSAPVGNVSGPFSAGTTPPKTSTAPDYRSHSSSQFWGLDSDRILQLFIGEIILAKQVDVLP